MTTRSEAKCSSACNDIEVIVIYDESLANVGIINDNKVGCRDAVFALMRLLSGAMVHYAGPTFVTARRSGYMHMMDDK